MEFLLFHNAVLFIAVGKTYLCTLYLRFVHSGIAKSIGTLYLLPRFVPAMCAVYAMITIIRDSGLINRIGQLFAASPLPTEAGRSDSQPYGPASCAPAAHPLNSYRFLSHALTIPSLLSS